jgi:hypothetical protein
MGCLVQRSGGEPHFKNDMLTLTPQAPRGIRFDHWTGDVQSSENPLSLTMDADKRLSAYFVYSGQYATVPYENDFEDSTGLGPEWVTFSQDSVDGRVIVAGDSLDFDSQRHLLMDHRIATSAAINYAALLLNLEGQSNVELSFQWADCGEENHEEDGIYFSDNGGVSFKKVHSLDSEAASNLQPQTIVLDVDHLARVYRLSLTSTFVIKFQSKDNNPFSLEPIDQMDGMVWDDIKVTATSSAESEISSIPKAFSLYPAYPNPFNPSTNLPLDLPKTGKVTVKVYNALGQCVAKPYKEVLLAAGHHLLCWDGRDETGRPLPSGVYIIELRASKNRGIQKVLLMK